MEQQPQRRSLLILLAVALVVIGVVVVKSLPKQQTASTPEALSENPLARSIAAVPRESTRYGSGEEALSDAAREAQATASDPDPKTPTEDQAPKPEPKAAPQAAAPLEEPSNATVAPERPEAEQEQIVEPLPGSQLAAALASGKPTMVDFGAGWCQACKMMDPVLKQSAKKYRGTANIVYVDTDKFPQIARDHHITAIPTQIFFDSSGKEANRHMGYWPIEEVAKQLAALGVGG
ncbi:MAG: thioredoxin family protein [Armatimonadetes bacterium]|nr:thioredoxin family protein [Armatimonadota bacterium]